MLDGYSFTDGVQTFTQKNSIFNNAQVSTDPTGQITAWLFDFASFQGIPGDIDTDNETFSVLDTGNKRTGPFGKVTGNPAH